MTNDHIDEIGKMDECNHVWSDPDITDEGDPVGYDEYPYDDAPAEGNFTDCGRFPHTSGVYLCLDAGTEWCSFHCPFSKMLEEPIADADKPYMQPHLLDEPSGDVPF